MRLQGYAALIKAKIMRGYRYASSKALVSVDGISGESVQPKDVLKITCIINGASFFSQLNQILPWIAYADKKKLVPIVETITDSEVTWDDFFVQPCTIDTAKTRWQPAYAVSISQNPTVLNNRSETQYWQKIARKYLRLTPETEQYCQQQYAQLKGKPTVACLCRGSDYLAMKPHAHPVQPTSEMCIRKVEEKMKQYGYAQVFLATEDVTIYQNFAEHFGEALVTVDTEYVNYDASVTLEINDYALNHNKKKIMDYFANVYILSKCDVMVAGVTSGSVSALMLSEEKKETYFFDLGRYE